MSRYLDVVFDTVAWCVSNDAIYYPMLIIMALSILATLGFLIRYIIKAGF